MIRLRPRARRAARHDRCLRAIVLLEIAIYGEVLSTSIQRDCSPHEPSTWVTRFARPTSDGRTGRWYVACDRCRLVMGLVP